MIWYFIYDLLAMGSCIAFILVEQYTAASIMMTNSILAYYLGTKK